MGLVLPATAPASVQRLLFPATALGLGLRGVGYLLPSAAPDLGRGVTPLVATPDLGRGVTPLGLLPFGHGVLPASTPDLGRGVVPLGGRVVPLRRAMARPWQLPALWPARRSRCQS